MQCTVSLVVVAGKLKTVRLSFDTIFFHMYFMKVCPVPT